MPLKKDLMLIGLRGNNLRFLSRHFLSRSIYVASQRSRPKVAKYSPKSAPKSNKITLKSDDSFDHIDKLEFHKEQMYREKVQELQKMTKSIAKIIQSKKDQQKQVEKLNTLPSIDIKKKTDTVYQALTKKPVNKDFSFDASTSTLVSPVMEIPESIQEKLGLSIKFLVSKTEQNWPLILQNLSLSGGFKKVPKKDIIKFINNIPSQFLAPVIPQLEALLKDVNITPSSKILNMFLVGLSVGREISSDRLEAIEKYVETIRKMKKNKLPKDTYEILIKVYGKNNDIDKINSLLTEMKALNLKIEPMVYTNVLQTLVYKARNHKDAVSLFDTMSFLSVETKPGTDAYKHIIVSYVNNNEVEKALDLYQEMLHSKTPITQEILVALSRGCVSRQHLKYKAWDFMFEIYENNWTPTLETLEYMLYLSSKDGDLALSRALYKRLASINAVTRRSFTFLLMGYTRCNIQEPLSIMAHPRGRNFRGNLIFQSEHLNSLDVPFLPVTDLTLDSELIAESNAIWAHAMMVRPEFIHDNAYITYLNIGAELGTFKEFMQRYELSKLVGDAANTRVIIEEDVQQGEEAGEGVDSEEIREDHSPISYQTKSHPLLTRSTLTYQIALKAAGRFKNYEFAQQVWEERGRYRKSSEFKSSTPKQKQELDFAFANEMVQALTKMNLLDDAIAIVLSTEYQFKWSWKQLNELYKSCEEIGHDINCKTLRSIAKRAQIRFEGKITRSQFRDYERTRANR